MIIYHHHCYLRHRCYHCLSSSSTPAGASFCQSKICCEVCQTFLKTRSPADGGRGDDHVHDNGYDDDEHYDDFDGGYDDYDTDDDEDDKP